MSNYKEKIRDHSHCNGTSSKVERHTEQISASPPNGIHVFPREAKWQKDIKQLVKAEVGDGRDHSKLDPTAIPNEEDKNNASTAFDKFSTDLTLSLITSSVLTNTPEERHSERIPTLYNEHELSETAESKTKNKIDNTHVAEVDSTVEFPISKSLQSGCAVTEKDGICYLRYQNETQMSAIMQLITKDLSEPYSIYTYRYFIHNWPHLCFLAMHGEKYVGAIVCKLDLHKKITRRGYIAMLAVDESVRRRNIGTNLVKMAIETMHTEGCDEVVLETEVTNKPALKLYENLGFVRDKRLFRYYLNGVDALRLKLWLR